MSVTKSSSRVVLIALVAVGTTLWADREARGDTAAGNPVLVIPLTGSVKGPAGDVSLSGEARIGTGVTKAEEFGDPPSVVVTIHLQGMTGKDSSGKKYEASGDGEVVRPLVASDRRAACDNVAQATCLDPGPWQPSQPTLSSDQVLP